MKVRLVNYKKLAFGLIKKSQKADNQNLYRLSSKYFSLAQKIFRIANTETQEKIDKNKNVIRELNRQRLSNFIEDDPNKEEIYALIESLEFPYEIPFGDTTSETKQKSIIKVFNLAITLQEKNISPDVALALAHMEPEILDIIQNGNRNIPDIEIPADYHYNNQTRADVLYQYLESKNQRYGFVDDRRMAFRNPALMIDIYLNLCHTNILPQLLLDRRDFLNLMYSEGENFSYDKEHFDSALSLNYIMGKNSIPFVQKCQLESKGNAIVDIPHQVDNTIAFREIEYSPNMSQFIVENYFKINLRKDIENWLKKEYPGQLDDSDLKRIYKELMASDDIVRVHGSHLRRSDFERDAYNSQRLNLSLILKNWNREVRVENEEYKSVQEIATNPALRKLFPFERITKILNDNIIAEDIGVENIHNYPLFDALLKYQKDDIKAFLRLQTIYDNKEDESKWYQNLTQMKVENKSFIGRVMPKDDIRFPFVGAITGCCQKLKGAGEEAFENTFGADSGVFIVTDHKDNIVAQSYIWINDKTITLDSLESKYEKVNVDDFKDIYQQACNKIFSRYFDVVFCGSNNTRFKISEESKFVPLNLYENNDPNHYTYDTANGREVLYVNPDKIDEYPFISVVSKAKNNLIEPYTEDEIEFLSTNNIFADMVEQVIVKKYTDDLDDSLNKENVIEYARAMITAYIFISGKLSPGIIALCEVFTKGVNFDSVTNEDEFQVNLNKWLRDGNYYQFVNHEDQNGEIDDQRISKLDEDIEKIYNLSNRFRITNLFKANKILYSPDLKDEMSKNEMNNFVLSLDDKQKDYLFKLFTENLSFENLITKRFWYISHEYDDSGHMIYPFFAKIINKYISESKFDPEDMKLCQKINLFQLSDDDGKVDLINNGFLDFYFSQYRQELIIPSYSEIYNLKNTFQYYSDNIDDRKIGTFANNLLRNINNLETGADYVWYLLEKFKNKNLINLDVNNVDIQNLLSKVYITEELPYEFNTIYSSAMTILGHREFLKFTPEINYVINSHLNRAGDLLRVINNINKIQKINITVLEPEIVDINFVDTCKMFGDKIHIRDEDKLKGIFHYLSDKELERIYNRFTGYGTKEYNDFDVISYVEEMISSLFDIKSNPNAIENMKRIVYIKVQGYLNNHREMMSENEPYRQPIMPQTPAQPEEENEITASNKKRLKYSIKIK